MENSLSQNYKLLSIDVGIKNCAYCILSVCNENKNIEILEWDILSLLGVDDIGKNCNTIDFVKLSKNLMNVFGNVFRDKLDKSTHIVIENQIGQNAIRMKCLQGMITQWFIDHEYFNVYYVSSSHKLNHILKENDLYTGEKVTYAQKKKLSIKIMENILKNNDVLQKWIELFSSSSKKDDLSDCFLQGYYYLNKNNIENKKVIIDTYDLK